MKTTKKTIKQSNVTVVKPTVKTEADYKAEAFVREYTSNGYNKAKAYRKLVNKPDMNVVVASQGGGRMVKLPKVKALLSGTAAKASRKLDQIIDDDDSLSQFAAIKLALAYEHGTPVSKSENVNVNVTLEDILRT